MLLVTNKLNEVLGLQAWSHVVSNNVTPSLQAKYLITQAYRMTRQPPWINWYGTGAWGREVDVAIIIKFKKILIKTSHFVMVLCPRRWPQTLSHEQGGPKMAQFFGTPKLHQILTDFNIISLSKSGENL